MINETELRGQLIKLCRESSQSEVARQFGDLSRSYISDIVSGKRRISKKIAKQLGYRLLPIAVPVERQYEKIGKK